MKNKTASFVKKSASLLLVLAMLLSTLSGLTVFAESTDGYYSTVASLDYEKTQPLTSKTEGVSVTTLNNGSTGYLHANPETTTKLTIVPISGITAGSTYTYKIDYYVFDYSDDAGGNFAAFFLSNMDGTQFQDWVGKSRANLNQWYTYEKQFTSNSDKDNWADIYAYGNANIIYDNLRIIDENGKTVFSENFETEKYTLPDGFYYVHDYTSGTGDAYDKALHLTNTDTDTTTATTQSGTVGGDSVGEDGVTADYTVSFDYMLLNKHTTTATDIDFAFSIDHYCAECQGADTHAPVGTSQWFYGGSKATNVWYSAEETITFQSNCTNVYARVSLYAGTELLINNIKVTSADGTVVMDYNMDSGTVKGNILSSFGGEAEVITLNQLVWCKGTPNVEDGHLYIDASELIADNKYVDIAFDLSENVAASSYPYVTFDYRVLEGTTVEAGKTMTAVSFNGSTSTNNIQWQSLSGYTVGEWANSGAINYNEVGMTAGSDNFIRFYVYSGVEIEIDNIKVYQQGGTSPIADINFATNGTFEESSDTAVTEEPETTVEKDYAIYADNSAKTDIQSNKIWFNVLGMSQISLEANKTYTLQFDTYTVSAGTAGKGFCYQGVTNTGGNAMGQKWFELNLVENTWQTHTISFTTTAALAYHAMYVKAGFVGYLDNFRVLDGSTEISLFAMDESCLGKTSEEGTVAEIPAELFETEETEEIDYAILIDNTANTGYTELYFHELGLASPSAPAGTYTVEYDFYALSVGNSAIHYGASKTDWSGNAINQVWKENLPFAENEWVTISFTATATDVVGYQKLWVGAGIKGYMDNFKLTASDGTVYTNFEMTAAELGKTSKSISEVVALPDDIVAAKTPAEKDYAILVDNSANTGYTELYFHELGLASPSAPAGTYTVEYDFYALSVGNSAIHYGASKTDWSGNAINQVWKENLPFVENEWVTISFTATATDVVGYQKLWVGAGIKGYMDNFKLTASDGTVYTNFEMTATELGKTSKSISEVVALPDDIVAAKTPAEEPEVTGDNYTISRIVDGTGIRTYGSNGVLSYYPADDTEFTVEGITLEVGTQYRLTMDYSIFVPSAENDNAVSVRNVLTDGAHDYIANPASGTESGTKEYVFTATQTALVIKVYGGCDVVFDNIILEKFTASSATDVAPVELKAEKYTDGVDTYIDITVDTTTSAKTFTLDLTYDWDYLEYVSGAGEKADVTVADSYANPLAVTVKSTDRTWYGTQKAITGEIAVLTFKVWTVDEAAVTFTADNFTGVSAEILPVTVSFNTRVVSLGALKRETETDSGVLSAVAYGMQLAVDDEGNENIDGELVSEKGFIAAIGYHLDAELALDSYNPYVKEIAVTEPEKTGTGYNVYTLAVTDPEADYPVAIRPYVITADGNTYYGDTIAASANDLSDTDFNVWAESYAITSDANLSISSTAAQTWQGANAISQGFIYMNGYTDEQIAIELERIDDMDIQMVRSYYDQTYSAYYDAETQTIGYDWNTAEMQGLVKWLKEMEERGVEVALNMSWGVGDVYRNHCTTYSYDDCGGDTGHATTVENAENPFWCVNYELGESAAIAAYGDWVAESMKYLVDECGLTNVKYLIMFTEPRQTTDNSDEWTVYQTLAKSAHDALDAAGIRDSFKLVGPNIALSNNSYAAGLGEEGATYIDDMEDILPLITDYIDIYSFHLYAPAWPADGLTAEDPTDNNYELYAKHFESFISTINKYDSGADYWLDEWNYGGEFIDSPYYATQLAQAVVAALNSGVENVMLWQLFETKWPEREDTGGEFVNGIHSMGLAPTLTESDVPYDVYYAYTLLTKYMGKSGATVYQGTGDNGVYTAMVENTDGTQSILVVNTNLSAKTVNITIDKAVNGTLLRHMYNPDTVTPTADAVIIAADKAIDDVSAGLTDIIPAGAVVVYTTDTNYTP